MRILGLICAFILVGIVTATGSGGYCGYVGQGACNAVTAINNNVLVVDQKLNWIIGVLAQQNNISINNITVPSLFSPIIYSSAPATAHPLSTCATVAALLLATVLFFAVSL